MKRSVATLTLCGLLMVAAVYGFMRYTEPTPTPLQGFTAPFVFGNFKPPEDNPLTQEAVQLGRRLFYDKRLSNDNTVSCSTCHIQQLAFTDGRARAVGVSGELLDFNSMSLVNLMWGARHFFWNGRVDSLEEQALLPIQHPDEMAQNLDALIDELKADDTYVDLFGRAYGKISAQNIASLVGSSTSSPNLLRRHAVKSSAPMTRTLTFTLLLRAGLPLSVTMTGMV